MIRKEPLLNDHFYHIYNLGIDKRDIFKSEHDFKRFVMLMHIANSSNSVRLDNLINMQNMQYEDVLRFETKDPLVSLGPWCLMNNHFHMIVRQSVDSGITEYMRKVCTGFSMHFNTKYQRSGALFGSKFKSKLIDSNDYMRYLFQYIHWNPLDIQFPDWKPEFKWDLILDEKQVQFIQNYDYSSYQDFLDPQKRLESRVISLNEYSNWS